MEENPHFLRVLPFRQRNPPLAFKAHPEFLDNHRVLHSSLHYLKCSSRHLHATPHTFYLPQSVLASVTLLTSMSSSRKRVPYALRIPSSMDLILSPSFITLRFLCLIYFKSREDSKLSLFAFPRDRFRHRRFHHWKIPHRVSTF